MKKIPRVLRNGNKRGIADDDVESFAIDAREDVAMHILHFAR